MNVQRQHRNCDADDQIAGKDHDDRNTASATRGVALPAQMTARD